LDEGCIISKKKEDVVAEFNYTCSNPACGKPFSAPLRAINLSLEKPEPYLACPYCLMQISAGETAPLGETGLGARTPKKAEETGPTVEKGTRQEPSRRCNHHLGYLSERSNREKIPEECITCADLIGCMLKNLKDRKNN
jgi:DNA-directed RNA polymerase subunit RPC12/RpoP